MQMPAVRIITAAAAVLISATMLQTNARADAGNEPTPAASTQAADAAAAKTTTAAQPTESAKTTEAAKTEAAAETPKPSETSQQSKAALPTESTEATATEASDSASPEASDSATAQTATPSATPTATASARVVARVGLAAVPDAAECTPQDRSSSITSLNVEGADELREWQETKVDFTGSLPLGGCAGDTVTITVPPQLSAHPGSFPVLDPDGVSMGTMVVGSDGVATLTFNDYVETHTNITFHGFLAAQVGNQMLPGQSYDLNWKVGTTVVTTPVTMAQCPNCDAPRTWPSKWANFTDGDPDQVTFGLVSAVTQGPNETIVFTDTLGAGQRLDCDSLVVAEADEIDAWGDIRFTNRWTPDSVTCDEAAGTLTVSVSSSKTGQYFRVLGKAIVTETRSSYTDEGTITQRGVTEPVRASAVVYSGGAGGDGETPQPTPTPTVTSPTPTPSETTPTQTPTPTPSETTPTGANPTPSDSTTTTPSTTTTTKTPTTPSTSLPQTGSDASALGAGVGLLLVLMGSGALLVARRRR